MKREVLRPAASQWKEHICTPSFATFSNQRSGWTTIRCASIGALAIFATWSMTEKPNEILGTSVPSITSRWMMSPQRLMSSMSFSRWRKSAARMEGAIWNMS